MKHLAYTGCFAILIWWLTPTTSHRVYQKRTMEPASNSQPYSMDWARIDLATGKYNPGARAAVFEQVQNRVSRAAGLDLEFISRGPDNIPGRTRAILEVYGSPEKLLVGSVTGGLYTSTNAGASWQPHVQFQNLTTSSSIISCIHQDTVSGNIYVGTGSSFDASGNRPGIAWPGYGIFVSDDDGLTFRHLESTTPENRFTYSGSPWLAVNRIRTDHAGIIYAATHYGLKRSADEGKTWEDVLFTGSSPNLHIVSDVVVSPSGSVLAALNKGQLYQSTTGMPNTFNQVLSSALPNTSSQRVCLAASPQKPEHIFALWIDDDACFAGVFETRNGGTTWNSALIPHAGFTPMNQEIFCNTGQGVYDACIAVDALDDNTFYIGGVELWRYDGNLKRIANEAGSAPFLDILPNYVHADKHYIYSSPNNPGELYVTSDGGIAVSNNRGETWQGINKGYISSQAYSVAFGNDGAAIFGAFQDNGTIAIPRDNPRDPDVGYEVFGNDGLDCDMSQISNILITSSQLGLVTRVNVEAFDANSFPASPLSGMNSGGPFGTRLRLWESIDDPLSRDSILFEAKREETTLTTGNGIQRIFQQTVEPQQASAIVDLSSIEIYSGTMLVSVDGSGGALVGDGTGSVSLNADGTVHVNLTFDQAPGPNAAIYIAFDQSFKAQSTIRLLSENLDDLSTVHYFEHRLEQDLNMGDQLLIRDPVQSLLAVNSFGGLSIYRNALNMAVTPTPITIPGIAGNVTALEYTKAGDVLFVGNQYGRVYRLSGLKNLYTQDDVSSLELEILPVSMSNGVTGIAVDPNDPNRVLVTAGGYNVASRIWLSENALNATPTFRNVHGDLPPMPVYDAEFDRNDENLVIIGTDFGLWATADIAASQVQWSDENNDLSYIPVYEIRQQSLPWDQAKNTGMYYIATHGRGLWESGSLVGIEAPPVASNDDLALSGLRIYPNPMQTQGTVEFESTISGNVELNVFDMNGRLALTSSQYVTPGINNIRIATGQLRSGTYYASLKTNSQNEVGKFMIFH